jgi:hypothetical protein
MKRWVRGTRPPRWSKVAGRRSMSWSTRDWIMEELTEMGSPQNFFLSVR